VEVELKRSASKILLAPSARAPELLDPGHYTVDFENEQVRVTRLHLGPGEKTPMVEHKLARLITYLTNIDLELTSEQGTSRREQRPAGKVEWLDPAVESARNAGATATEAVVIYFKY
jgi:hypothetical protein